jgi:hypothetical protein
MFSKPLVLEVPDIATCTVVCFHQNLSASCNSHSWSFMVYKRLPWHFISCVSHWCFCSLVCDEYGTVLSALTTKLPLVFRGVGMAGSWLRSPWRRQRSTRTTLKCTSRHSSHKLLTPISLLRYSRNKVIICLVTVKIRNLCITNRASTFHIRISLLDSVIWLVW